MLEKKAKKFLERVARFATTQGMADADPATDKPRVLGFQIPESLENELTAAAEKLHLSKSSVARLALQRGLTVLLEQLSQEGPTA